MFFYLLFVSAYYIKSLDTHKYIGKNRHNSIKMAGIEDALDFKLTMQGNTQLIKLSSDKLGFIATNRNSIYFSKFSASLFEVIYSFNGGFLLKHMNNCITSDTQNNLAMKKCSGLNNKFIIINNSSEQIGEEYIMKFYGNEYEITRKLSTELSYRDIDSKDFVVMLEQFKPKNTNFPHPKRREFVKINNF